MVERIAERRGRTTGDGEVAPATARSRPAKAPRGTAKMQPPAEKAEKKGFDTGIVAVHPLIPDRKLKVFVANFVLMGYGTGAIFGCPAHDQRDFEFATKYGLTITPVVVPADQDPAAFKRSSRRGFGGAPASARRARRAARGRR